MNMKPEWNVSEAQRHLDSVLAQVLEEGFAIVEHQDREYAIIKKEYYDMLEGVDYKSDILDQLHRSICIERAGEKHILYLDEDTIYVFSRCERAHGVVYRERQYPVSGITVTSNSIELGRAENDTHYGMSRGAAEKMTGRGVDCLSMIKTMDTIDAFIRVSEFEEYNPEQLKIDILEDIDF